MSTRMVRMSIDVPAKDHKRIKALATIEGVSIKDFVTECVQEKIYPERTPNKTTKKAISDLRKRRNVKKAKNLNELFDDLGI